MITIEDIDDMLFEDAADREAHDEEAQSVPTLLEIYLSEMQANIRVIKAYQEAFERGDYR